MTTKLIVPGQKKLDLSQAVSITPEQPSDNIKEDLIEFNKNFMQKAVNDNFQLFMQELTKRDDYINMLREELLTIQDIVVHLVDFIKNIKNDNV